MENINNEKINIFGLHIDKIDYGLLLSRIYIAVTQNSKLTITYANSNTLNKIYKDKEQLEKLNTFDIIHPDGIGIYFASRILYGKKGLIRRMTGSDFYPLLIQEAKKRDWSFYFFGHDKNTLKKIRENNSGIKIAGYSEGYNYDTEKVINNINNSNTNILIAGLGFPLQDEWIYLHKDKIKCNVIIAVGDGIKVYANTKLRGPVFIRRIGFEWLARLIGNPAKYWKRYLIGNPVFLYRIIKLKMSKFAKV